MKNAGVNLSTEAILTAGWLVRLVMDNEPQLKTQLSHLLREIWETAAIAEGITPDELSEKFNGQTK